MNLQAVLRRFQPGHGLAAFGILGAAVIFICVNILVSRFFKRWDLTSAGLYTLSPVTLDALSALQEPVEVVVFLAYSDPLTSSVRYMLDAYRSHSQLLHPRFVDPDRNPAEFVALQKEYGIFEGRTENGRLATEASIVVSRGQKRWFITTDDLVEYDEQSGEARPRLEQALTEALSNVRDREAVKVCVTRGHLELDLDSGGSQGLSEFRLRLEQNNYKVESVDLVLPDPKQRLRGCQLVVVAGAQQPFSVDAAERLAQYLRSGGAVLLASGPVVNEAGDTVDAGLGPLLSQTGIKLGEDLVLEGDPKLRLPIGFAGEVFLSTPRSHDTTEALIRRGEATMRVLLQLSQSVQLLPDASARCILETSNLAYGVDSFRALASQDFDSLRRAQENTAAERCVAAAFSGRGSPAQSMGKLLVVGTPSVLWSSTWREPSLLGTRRFVENAVSWLAAQPQLVSVPEKQSSPAGLALTDAALSEVQRYVLLYMPLCVLLLGGLVMWRRRHELAAVSGSDQESES